MSEDLAKQSRQADKEIEGAGRGLYYGADKNGPVTIAVFDDSCGNLIQLYQV